MIVLPIDRNGHLTNFAPEDLAIYTEAVETFPDKNFRIGEPYGVHAIKTHKGLYTTRKGDCTDFWDHFDKVAERHGGTQVDKFLQSLKQNP